VHGAPGGYGPQPTNGSHTALQSRSTQREPAAQSVYVHGASGQSFTLRTHAQTPGRASKRVPRG